MMEGVGVGEGLSGVVQRSDKHFIASILKPLGAKAILCYCEVLTVLETSRKWKMELCERRKSIGVYKYLFNCTFKSWVAFTL